MIVSSIPHQILVLRNLEEWKGRRSRWSWSGKITGSQFPRHVRVDGLFSPSLVGRWLFNLHWSIVTEAPCSGSSDLYPIWGPGHRAPSGSPVAVLGRWAAPAALLHVAFGEEAHSVFPNCRHGLSSALLLELMLGVCVFRVDTVGESCFLHRLRLSRRPSLVVILLSLCWAPARQLVWAAWLFVILLSTPLGQKALTRPRLFFSLFAGREKGCSPWPEQAMRIPRAGYHALGGSVQTSNLDL